MKNFEEAKEIAYTYNIFCKEANELNEIADNDILANTASDYEEMSKELKNEYKKIAPKCINTKCKFYKINKLFNCSKYFWVTDCLDYKPKEMLKND